MKYLSKNIVVIGRKVELIINSTITMKRKYLVYAMLPVFAAALTVGGVASANGWFGMGMGNLTPDQIATNQQTMFQKQAELLGVSVDEVKNAWASGKSMRDLAAEKGISTDQFHEKMRAQRTAELKEYLNALVSKGVITQSQADQKLKIHESNDFRGKGMGKGMGKHMRGMGMGMGF